MKTLLFIIVTIFPIVLSAQPFLPLGEGRLRAEAIQQSREVEVMLATDTALQGGYDWRVWTGVKSTPDIALLAKELKPTLTTATPEDRVYSYIRVINKDGDALFWGYTHTSPVKVDGKWKLPESAGQFDLEFSSLPVTFSKEIGLAQVLVKNQYGYYDTFDVSFSGNKLFLTEDLESKDGILRLYFVDGTTVWYSTKTGHLLPTFDYAPAVSLGFPDVWSYKNPTSVSLVVKTAEKRGNVPTFEVVMTTAGKVAFDISTSENAKRPRVFWFKKASPDADWDRIDVSASVSTAIEIPLSSGINYVVPEWDTTDFIPNTSSSTKG